MRIVLAGKVNLRKGELTVSYVDDVSDELIKATVERAGYTAELSDCSDLSAGTSS